MSKHSTGPWKWEEGQPKIFTTWNGKDYVIASVEESRLGWHEDRNCESRERGANARLIAAAPDLLDHVKLFARTLEYQIKKDQRDGDDEGANLKAVTLARVNDDIAKAEGRP